MDDHTPDAPPSEEEVTPSARANEELIRTLSRLKLRLELCLRRDVSAADVKNVIVACLSDVDEIARGLPAIVKKLHRVE